MAPRRILVIDDDTVIREILSRLISDEGHFVATAEGGIPGLKALEEGGFDTVITDIIMPDKEGLEIIMEIKTRWPSIKIIAMSGAMRRETYLELASHFGVSATLAKPFRAQELKDILILTAGGI